MLRDPIQSHSVPSGTIVPNVGLYEVWGETGSSLIRYREKCSRIKSSEIYAVSTSKQFPTLRRNTVLLFSRCSRRPIGPEEKPNTSLRNNAARTSKLAEKF